MAGTLYLALECSGFETLILTDGVNYSLDNQSGGWIPALGLDEEQRTVTDAIPINILPGAGGTTVRRNLIRLTQMLRQISRGQQDDGSVVWLTYVTPGSSPAQRISAQVIGWNSETFLPSTNAAENLPVDTINVVTLVLEHRVPWVYVSYVNENLLLNSAWSVNPNWTTTPVGGLTYVAAPPPLPAGGLGYIQVAVPASTLKTILAPTTQSFNVVSGQTYTVFFRAAGALALSSIRLRNNTDTANISALISLATQSPLTTSIVGGGTVIRAVFVPTASDAQARIKIEFQVTDGVAITYQLGEFLVVVGDIAEDGWHMGSNEEGVSSTSAATALGVLQTTVIPATASRAPTKLTYNFGAGVGWETGVLIVAAQGGITLGALPPVSSSPAGFTSISDTAGNYAMGGTILRYTPTVITDAVRSVSGPAAPRAGIVVLAARVNGIAATYEVMIRATTPNGEVLSTRRRSLAPRTQPYYIVLGRLSIPTSGGSVTWDLVVTASATGGTIDFDWWAFIADNHDTHVITHGATFSTAALSIDPRWLSDPLPSGLNSPDNQFIATDALALDTLWVVTDATTKWRLDPATIVPTLTIRRPPAFDAPV